MECLMCLGVSERSPFVRPMKIATCTVPYHTTTREQRREVEGKEKRGMKRRMKRRGEEGKEMRGKEGKKRE